MKVLENTYSSWFSPPPLDGLASFHDGFADHTEGSNSRSTEQKTIYPKFSESYSLLWLIRTRSLNYEILTQKIIYL